MTEVDVILGEGPWKGAKERSEILPLARRMLEMFDWHSLITLHIDHCDRGAVWERNGRRILLCDNVIDRLEDMRRPQP